MKNPLNAILVGYGTMGKRHMDRFAACGVQFSKIIDSPDAFFLNGCNPDFVVIASPATTHYDYAKACLERKIPVFVEKPLAITGELAEELVRLASANDTLLFVAQSECFNPIFLNFRTHFVKELKNASSSRCLDVNLEFRREHKFSERCRDVNVALDLLVHDISLFLTMFDYNSVRVAACDLSKDGDRVALTLEADDQNAKVHAHFYANRNSSFDMRLLAAKFGNAEYAVSLARHKENGDVEHVPDSLDNEHRFFLKLLAGACGEWGRRLSKTAADAVAIVSKCGCLGKE